MSHKSLLYILNANGLTQRVNTPTHQKGHPLNDLLISSRGVVANAQDSERAG